MQRWVERRTCEFADEPPETGLGVYAWEFVDHVGGGGRVEDVASCVREGPAQGASGSPGTWRVLPRRGPISDNP